MLKIFGNVCGIIFLVFLFTNNVNCDSDRYDKDDTLATINNRVITLNQFIKTYREKLVLLGLNDSYEMRNKYLYNLINDEILIEEAKNLGHDKTEVALSEARRFEIQEFLNAYSLKHISSSIKVTDGDLKELFVKMNTKVKVSHLYSSTKEGSNSIYKALMDGESWENLASKCFDDPQLKENGGSLGFISVDEMDPEFEKAAFNLKRGEISKPVKTVYGYSIIRLEDIKTNPFITDNEFLKVKGKIAGLARKRIYEEKVKAYTQNMRMKLNINFDDILLSQFYNIIKGRITASGLRHIKLQRISEEDKTNIVTSSFMNLTVQKVLVELANTKDGQLKWIRTKENLEDFIAGLIIRYYIVALAKKEELNKTIQFKENVTRNFESFLLTKIEDEINSKIKISADSIRSYYDRNRHLFISEPEIRLSSILLDRKTAADSIKEMLSLGLEFGDLASKYSIQKLIANQLGDIGFFSKKELGVLVEEIFKLSQNHWKGPIESDGKFIFLKCTGRKESELKPFEAVSIEIEKVLKALNFFNERNKIADSLKSKINYKVFSQKLTEIKIY